MSKESLKQAISEIKCKKKQDKDLIANYAFSHNNLKESLKLGSAIIDKCTVKQGEKKTTKKGTPAPEGSYAYLKGKHFTKCRADLLSKGKDSKEIFTLCNRKDSPYGMKWDSETKTATSPYL